MDCGLLGSSVHGILQARILVKVKAAHACPTLCDPMDYTVHGIFQTRILECVASPSPVDLPNPGIEWVAISFSRGPSQPRDRTSVSHIVGSLCLLSHQGSL